MRTWRFGLVAGEGLRLPSWGLAATRGLQAGGAVLARVVGTRSGPRPGRGPGLVDGGELLDEAAGGAPDFWLDLRADGTGPGPRAPFGCWRVGWDTEVAFAGSGGVQQVRVVSEGRVLHRARLRVRPSLAASRAIALGVAAELPVRVFVELRERGQLPGEGREPVPGTIGRVPGRVRLVWRALGRRLRDLAEDLFEYDLWNVGTVALAVTRPEHLAGAGPVRWLPPRPPLRYLADPFPIGSGEFLAEEYSYARGGRGQIVRVGPGGVAPEPGLEEEFHVSYPGLVRDDAGGTCCVPESYQAGSVRLYRRAGDRWQFARTLLTGSPFVDPTVFRHQGRWWIFASDTGDGGHCRLSAWYAEALEGGWTPHPWNPLVRDLVGGRPAGPVFRLGEGLYRPGQDCSATYGGAVVVSRIEELTPTRFREVPVVRMEPDREGPWPDGLHHLVVEPDGLVIDGKRRVRDPWFWLRSLLG